MAGKEYCKRDQRQIGNKQNTYGDDQMPAPFRVPARQRFILAEDLLITILKNKNVVEKHRRQQINADGKKAGFVS
jgi:hypothetical protein